MRWFQALSTAAAVRAALVVMAVTVSLLKQDSLEVLPWALLVLTLDLVAAGLLSGQGSARPARRLEAFLLVMLAALCAGVAVSAEVGGVAGALPLLLVPAFRAGEVWGRLAAAALIADAAGLGLAVASRRGTLDTLMVINILEWGGLALALGFLGAWSARLQSRQARAEPGPAAREAARLLRRLDTLAGALDGGFDAPASAELLLNAVDAEIVAQRMAVLVGFGDDPAVPLALRGSERLPWDEPTVDDGVLGRVWRTGQPEIGFWTNGEDSRAMLAVPLHDTEGARIGVVVADRIATAPYEPRELRAAAVVAEVHSANIDVALIFAALRERAGMEERERLAREMHDGIAQELVALGYRIDVLRRQATGLQAPLAGPMDVLRADLTAVLADLRLRIADLRIAVRPDQGLGAVIGARLQQFGAASGLTVGLRLNESGFRLPAHVETLLYRLVLDFLADARHAEGTTTVEVALDVAAPQAFLRLAHDGDGSLVTHDFSDHPLTALGADVAVDPLRPTGVALHLHLRSRRPHAHHRLLTTERIPQRS